MSLYTFAPSFHPHQISAIPLVSRYQPETPWYVIHSCCHHEAKVEERLLKMSLTVFLPRHTVISRRRDRKRLIQVPLFPGYLFIQDHFEPEIYHSVLNLPGVVRLLAIDGRLQAVPAATIAAIKAALASGRPHQPHAYLQKGKWVRVVEGPLAGVVGIVIKPRTDRRRIVIEVELFRQAVAVELEDEAVEPWHKPIPTSAMRRRLK